MRIKFVQEIIDRMRGKSLAGRTIAVKMNDVNTTSIDRLFDEFPFAEFEINGKSRKCLTNVNADRGVTEQALSLLCEAFPSNRKNVKVLNIGCGKKNQMAFLDALGFDAYGLDYDIEDDSEKLKFHDLNTQDDIPFKELSFDCVVCQEIIEHIENPWLLFRKIKKVIKIGGILIVTTPNISSNSSKKIFINNNIGFFAYFDKANLWQHINPIPYWEMIHISTFNGFESVALSGCNEYYVNYVPKKSGFAKNEKRDVTIQNNDILHYVFRNLNSNIKLYNPVPTYNYDWSSGVKGDE